MTSSHTVMDVDTLEALRGSIRKWEGIVAGTVGDRGPDNCPLCTRFYDAGCNGCPVAEKTGMRFCEETPYTTWSDMDSSLLSLRNEDDRKVWYVDSEQSRNVAQAELDFLKSLLPPDARSDEQVTHE